MKNFLETKLVPYCKEYWRYILVALASVVVIGVILGVIISVFTSNGANSAEEAAMNYGVGSSDIGLSVGGYDSTLRVYRDDADEYIENRYVSQYVNEDAAKSNSEDDENLKSQFQDMMLKYFKLYLSMYGDSTDDFMNMYFNQLKTQKVSAYSSAYISSDFMMDVYKANLDNYHQLNLKALTVLDSGEFFSECTNVVELTKEEKKEYIDGLSDNCKSLFEFIDVKTSKIKKVKKCTVETYVGKDVVNTQELYVVKVRGGWYVIDN